MKKRRNQVDDYGAYLPTQQEIRTKCKEIQEKWTDQQLRNATMIHNPQVSIEPLSMGVEEPEGDGFRPLGAE